MVSIIIIIMIMIHDHDHGSVKACQSLTGSKVLKLSGHGC